MPLVAHVPIGNNVSMMRVQADRASDLIARRTLEGISVSPAVNANPGTPPDLTVLVGPSQSLFVATTASSVTINGTSYPLIGLFVEANPAGISAQILTGLPVGWANVKTVSTLAPNSGVLWTVAWPL